MFAQWKVKKKKCRRKQAKKKNRISHEIECASFFFLLSFQMLIAQLLAPSECLFFCLILFGSMHDSIFFSFSIRERNKYRNVKVFCSYKFPSRRVFSLNTLRADNRIFYFISYFTFILKQKKKNCPFGWKYFTVSYLIK